HYGFKMRLKWYGKKYGKHDEWFWQLTERELPLCQCRKIPIQRLLVTVGTRYNYIIILFILLPNH
ncbi:hypothetical protein, partial [Endozoicomonas sp. YOMI1]|uniref:hypothetical protein n=1 Tax=Endozoicomonas sp. YOMI1 TaxID=2828739 RepID=UPI0021485CC9